MVRYTRHQHEDYDTVFNYFDIGDKVRHHKDFDGYEKYDKSKDTIMLLHCMRCNSMTFQMTSVPGASVLS